MSIIETQDLSKVYGRGEAAVTALDRVSLSVIPGEFVAVMGPSGCGKSTLLHLIGGLDHPTGGHVLYEGTDLARLDDRRLTELRRRKMGFVFQFYNLMPVLGGLENTALPLILDGLSATQAYARASEWLARVGLEDRLGHRPSEMSGGQQQRVAIARALVAEPPLILADEPTGNLDTQASDEIAALLRRAASEWGRTVIMVTHDPRIAAHADRIVFLKDGRVVDQTRLDGHGQTQFVTNHVRALSREAAR